MKATADHMPKLYGLMARFETPEALLTAAAMVRDSGYRQFDAFAPFPLEGLDEAIGFRTSKVQIFTFIGGLVGGLFGYSLQYWVNVHAYPINIGGRPLNSIPSFIPATFEMTILFSSLTAVISMIVLNKLPLLHHPVFNSEVFVRHGSRDGFFLCLESSDSLFDRQRTREFLISAGAREVHDVHD